jgi:hypothetical protein
MQSLPQLESLSRIAFEAGDAAHPSGVALSSYFVRAPTRGRRRADLDPVLLFPAALRAKLGARADHAIRMSLDAQTWRTCASPRPTVPVASREWLSEAALALGKAEGFSLTWALLGAVSEMEAIALRLLGSRTSRATARQVLHGVSQRTLRVEPFASFVIRVLKIAQAAYAAFRHAGCAHEDAWAGVQDRLWNPHPTGRPSRSGGEARGAYLPSLLQASAGHARKRLRRSADGNRTQDHARALLARFAAGPGAKLWPWVDGAGRLLPHAGSAVTPQMAAVCFFAVLLHAAGERRTRGGPSGGLSAALVDAGFAASEWLPDRTDDLAVRLLAAGTADGAPAGDVVEAMSALVRATVSRNGARDIASVGRKLELPAAEAVAVLDRARDRLPGLAQWLEENARDLLEKS